MFVLFDPLLRNCFQPLDNSQFTTVSPVRKETHNVAHSLPGFLFEGSALTEVHGSTAQTEQSGLAELSKQN